MFGKELHSYAENVNEINDETMKLLTQTIMGINKLQVNSKFRESSTIHGSSFVNNLNDEIFKCRRVIVCCLCHVSIHKYTFIPTKIIQSRINTNRNRIIFIGSVGFGGFQCTYPKEKSQR